MLFPLLAHTVTDNHNMTYQYAVRGMTSFTGPYYIEAHTDGQNV